MEFENGVTLPNRAVSGLYKINKVYVWGIARIFEGVFQK